MSGSVAFSEPHLPAVAALAEPLGEAEHEVESQLLGADGAFGVVLEVPRRPARQRRRAPRALLERDEQPQHQRLPPGALQRRETIGAREIGRSAHAWHRRPRWPGLMAQE